MSDYSGGGGDVGGQQRVKGVTLVKPIVFGNISKQFPKKRESDGHTHEWTVYFKPYDNEDMSNYIKKVQFKLHESYANPNRVVSKPPYEVSETGWGEFEVQVKIHFNDAANEKPLIFYHVLKLFHGNSSGSGTGSGSAGTANAAAVDAGSSTGATTSAVVIQGRKTVISECYDEMIFHEPTQYIHTLLTTTRPITLDAYKHDTDFEEKKKKTLDNIKSGSTKVQSEIVQLKEKLELAKETLNKFKSELNKAQEEQGMDDDSVFGE